jgi:hypothetical protein
MPHGEYKKMLFRVPADVLAYLEARSDEEVRSVNAEWVYLLRQLMKQDQLSARQGDSRSMPPQRPRRATAGSY